MLSKSPVERSTQMHHRIVPLVVGAAILIGSAALAIPSAQAAGTVVTDANFASCLNTTYLKQSATATITAAQLNGLKGSVACYGSVSNTSINIKSLAGAQYLTGITSLSLSPNSISDVTPLAGLTKLTDLDLSNNLVSNLTPLAKLTNLTSLSIIGGKVANLTPLANLTKLKTLWLYGNQFSDLTPLAKLTNLTKLDVGSNKNLSNLAPVAKLPNLAELDASGTNVSNLTPLTSLTKLTHLEFSGNNLSNLTQLAKLTNLTYLYVGSNNFSDLTPLAGLTKLTTLSVGSNKNLSNLAPLAKLTNLTSLYASFTNVADLTPLASLTKLTYLDVGYDQNVSNLAPLAKLTNLTTLWLSSDPVSNLAPLATVTSLTYLYLDYTLVSDVTPLAKLTKLTSLWLDHDQVTNISSLNALPILGGGYVSFSAPKQGDQSGQAITLPSAVPGTVAAPIVGATKLPIKLTVTSGPAKVNSSGTVTYTGTGTVKFSWTSSTCSSSVCFSGTATQTVTASPTVRSGGADRYATATLIAQQGWKSASTVYLAYGYNFPDALAGVSLAAVNNAPILLTGTDAVPDSTMNQLGSLNAKTVVLLGGTAAISTAVEKQLKTAGYTVKRIAGTDRYDTAARIGTEVLAKSKSTTAVIATGDGFADALSISPVAGMNGWPVLFATKANTLPTATSDFIKANNIKTVYIVGGTGAVGSGVEAALKKLGVTTVTRLAGIDRYDTSAKIATKFKSSFTSNVSVATGSTFADALTGGVLSAKLKIPMLLLSPQSGANPGEKTYAKGLKSPKIYVYGGTTALPDSVVKTLLG